MGEETKAIGFQGTGQSPVPPSTPEVAQGNPVQPEYITREEAQRMMEDVYRKAQGLIDKTNAGTLKKVQERLANIDKAWEYQEKAGQVIDPNLKQAMRTQIMIDAMKEPDPAPASGGQPAQAAPQDGGQVNPIVAYVNATCDGIEKTEGVVLEDAEVHLLDNILDPYEYITAFRKAVTDKKARLTSQPQTPNPATRTPTNLGGNGTHNPNPIKNITDPNELYKLAFGKGG